MSPAENKETVRKMYASLEHGNMEAFGAALHADYVWQITGEASWSQRFEGRDDIQAGLLRPLFAQFGTRFRARATNLIAEGEYVVAEVRGEVTTKRGERYNNQYCFIFKFRDGKIAEIIEYGDTDLEERVLGRYEEAAGGATGS